MRTWMWLLLGLLVGPSAAALYLHYYENPLVHLLGKPPTEEEIRDKVKVAVTKDFEEAKEQTLEELREAAKPDKPVEQVENADAGAYTVVLNALKQRDGWDYEELFGLRVDQNARTAYRIRAGDEIARKLPNGKRLEVGVRDDVFYVKVLTLVNPASQVHSTRYETENITKAFNYEQEKTLREEYRATMNAAYQLHRKKALDEAKKKADALLGK